MMVCVRPGVELVNAKPGLPVRRLSKLDFPTLLLPRKAISGSEGAGNRSGFAALIMCSASIMHQLF